MSEQKSTKKHADTSKAPRTAPTMASMAAAIHAAKVRSSEKTGEKNRR